MSHPQQQMTMTEEEFRGYLNRSFDEGAESALRAIEGIIAALRERGMDTTTPDPAVEAAGTTTKETTT